MLSRPALLRQVGQRPVQPHLRTASLAAHHLGVAEADAVRQPLSEGLHHRLLGREAGGEALVALASLAAALELRGGEHAPLERLSASGELRHPLDGDDVDADREAEAVGKHSCRLDAHAHMIARTKGAPVADLILEIIEGGEPGRQIELVDSIEIGRDPSASVALEDDQASRRHARISVQGGQAVAEDLGSTNGTYVNDQPISGPRPLQADDRIRIGGTVFQLRTTQQISIQATAVRPVPQVTTGGPGRAPARLARRSWHRRRRAASDAPRVVERAAASSPTRWSRTPTRDPTTTRSRASWTRASRSRRTSR